MWIWMGGSGMDSGGTEEEATITKIYCLKNLFNKSIVNKRKIRKIEKQNHERQIWLKSK